MSTYPGLFRDHLQSNTHFVSNISLITESDNVNIIITFVNTESSTELPHFKSVRKKILKEKVSKYCERNVCITGSRYTSESFWKGSLN